MASVSIPKPAAVDIPAPAHVDVRAAVEGLVREHEGWLRSVILGVLGRGDPVDDVMQKVWAQVLQRYDSLQDAGRVKPWLYSIARHAALDFAIARRRRSTRTAGESALVGLADPGRDAEPDATVAGREAHELILREIGGLPAIYREPFVLRHLENWSYAQIGEVLGLPLDTVETRLVRARRLLREALSGKV